jgi:trans-aconitate methyltransferase
MKAALAAFYDRALADRRNSQWHPVQGNPYQRLWEASAALVPDGCSVVELGCGTGRLASLLVARARTYVGVDFSPRCIAEAQRFVPGAAFALADLRSDQLIDAEVYVANEVLEHLDDDLGLLSRIPRGALVIVSVPSFDSASHVRHFPEPDDARARYASALLLDHLEHVPHGSRGRFFHLLRGTRR